MGFSGYDQILCLNGHKSSADCYEETNFDGPEVAEWYEGVEYPMPSHWTCRCGAKAAWWNQVNTTNGSLCETYDEEGTWVAECGGCEYCENGRIDGHVELEIDKPAVTQVCNLGHEHVIEEQTYKIPKDKGHLTKWSKENENMA